MSWDTLLGRGYQVQYTTDLGSTNWINLGHRLTATNSTATVTDSVGSDPHRFYRVHQSP